MNQSRPFLKTSVPAQRPQETIVTLCGDTVKTFRPLSPEHRLRGRLLREERVGRGLYLGDAAQLLGVTLCELSECEAGVREFELDEVRRLFTERVGSRR